jgi:formate-dependent nitrite reductase membrane component NrfD
MIKMGLYTAPTPNTPYGIQAPLLQINQYPLWSEYVALALYFTELAGMLMAIIGILEIRKYSKIVKPASVAIFASAVLALVFFDLDLGRPTKGFYAPLEAIFNFDHSWMARGVIFVSGLLLFSFIYMILNLLNIKIRWLRVTIAVLGMFAGIFSTVYSGFELAATTGVPFWNNGALPLLYLADGVFVGSALAYIIAFFMKGDEAIKSRILFTRLLAFSTIAVLSSWFLFLASTNYINCFNEVAYYYLLSSPTFTLDLALEFVTLAVSGFTSFPTFGPWLPVMKLDTAGDLPKSLKYIMLAIAIVALFAGYLTRADVLFVGQYAYQVAPMAPFQDTSSQPVPIGAFGWRG